MSPILNLLSRGFGIKQKQKQNKTSIMSPILNLLTRGFRIKFVHILVRADTCTCMRKTESIIAPQSLKKNKKLLQYISVTVNRDV